MIKYWSLSQVHSQRNVPSFQICTNPEIIRRSYVLYVSLRMRTCTDRNNFTVRLHAIHLFLRMSNIREFLLQLRFWISSSAEIVYSVIWKRFCSQGAVAGFCIHCLHSVKVYSAPGDTFYTQIPVSERVCSLPETWLLLAEYSPPSCFRFFHRVTGPTDDQIVPDLLNTNCTLSAWWRGGQLATQLCHLCNTHGAIITIATKEFPPQETVLHANLPYSEKQVSSGNSARAPAQRNVILLGRSGPPHEN